MRAVILSQTPSSRAAIIEHLSVTEEIARPVLKSDQVLVRVKASALNIEDIINGVAERPGLNLKASKDSPVVLGQEFSGVVEDIGSKVKNFKVGDNVVAHKMPFRVRLGSWAEFVSVAESVLVVKPPSYSFSEAAALPMSALVAYGAVKSAGFLSIPLVQSDKQQTATTSEADVEAAEDNPALVLRRGSDLQIVQQARVAVVGASSTIGLMVVDMLVSRGVKVLGVSSASSAPTVLSSGALAVLDRNKGGLAAKKDLSFDVIIDCVGGQDVEDAARKAMEGKGHFVTVTGPGDNNTFADVGTNQLTHGFKIASRSFKSLFTGTKYTLASMPLTGKTNILKQLMEENLKSVVDSEVEMFNEEALIAAVNKVNNHKTRGRLVLIIN